MAHSSRKDAPDLPDFSLLKRIARDQLIYLLEQLPGKKDLFIEADLMSPLDRIANVTTLKEHEVDKLYKVDHKPIYSTSDQLCFLIRPRIQTVKWIADIVNADKAAGKLRSYKIIFSPQKFYACEAVLEEQGIYGDVSTDEWAFHLLPLDDDIISLELPEFFRDNFLGGDQRWVTTAGSALHLLHSVYGPFSKAYGIGRCAKMVYESWREQGKEGEKKTPQSEIGTVFLVDRDVDFVTPLCSQVVYEGLVDDIFRIKCGSVEFTPDVTSSEKSVKVMLNSQDKVFGEIRNEHFSNVFGLLSQKARNLQTAYDRRRGMDIKQMKTFVSEELKGLKQEHHLLSLHIGASESMMKRKTKQDFQELLKTELLCLLSLTENGESQLRVSIITLSKWSLIFVNESGMYVFSGLLPKDYRSLKAQYLQSYGTEHLLTFANLRQLGLLVEQQAGETLTVMESKVGKLVNDKTVGKLTDAFSSLAKKSNFRALSKRLALVPKTMEEYDLRTPRDMAYIFSGAYIPLSCKLIEQVLEREGWTGLEEVTRLLNGNEFVGSDSQRIILVMFLGGCSYSEISALRFLGKEKGYKFIVVTTAIINAARLLEAMLDNYG
uniref:VPS33B late endosome and lysosome associated n=1 Tax=Paramormyrops kingsleyae TaxID=1676925 RepID=A0A3B3T9Q0_9TELE